MWIWFLFIAASCRSSVARVFSTCYILDFHSFPVCAWNPDSLCMPLISSAKRNLIDSSPEASTFMRGARVLARREADGYYYLGHIAQEVKVAIYRELCWKRICVSFPRASHASAVPCPCCGVGILWYSALHNHYCLPTSYFRLFPDDDWLVTVRGPTSKSSLEINPFQ